MKNKTIEKEEYLIKTIDDILKAVNKKNVDDFLIDFSTWLKMAVEIREQDNEFLKMLTGYFKWTDDGKAGQINSITFKIKPSKSK